MDLANCCLVNASHYSGLTHKLDNSSSLPVSLQSVIEQLDRFTLLLSEYLELTCPIYSSYSLGHAAITTSLLLIILSRNVPEKLNTPFAEFKSLMKIKIVWPSSSDYNNLNKVLTPDRYPVPHLQDLTALLVDSSVFSKNDLIWTHHKGPLPPILVRQPS